MNKLTLAKIAEAIFLSVIYVFFVSMKFFAYSDQGGFFVGDNNFMLGLILFFIVVMMCIFVLAPIIAIQLTMEQIRNKQFNTIKFKVIIFFDICLFILISLMIIDTIL